jgi:hypothetical protein
MTVGMDRMKHAAQTISSVSPLDITYPKQANAMELSIVLIYQMNAMMNVREKFWAD